MPVNCVGYFSSALTGEIKLPSRYLDINHIGQGATCVVLKAHDSFLDRAVAIKFMKPELTDFRSVRRFQQEAKVMSAFRLKNLPVVLDFGLSPCGRPYMVMELVEGTSLKEIIEEKGILSVGLALEVTIQILSALVHAHERDIVHRDLKSQNVMVSWDEEGLLMVKVVDFGLANGINRPGHITEHGAALGTPFYMSPEQAQGRVTDARSDIYSLGCVLFEMLTGRTPFERASMTETLDAHIRTIAPSLGSMAHIDNDMLGALECVVAKCLEKDPQKRFVSAAELRGVLEDLCDNMRRDEAQRLRRLLRVASVAGMNRHSTSLTNLKAIQIEKNDGKAPDCKSSNETIAFHSWNSGMTRSQPRNRQVSGRIIDHRRAAAGMTTILLVMALALIFSIGLLLIDPTIGSLSPSEKLPVEIGDLRSSEGFSIPASTTPGYSASELIIRTDYFGKEAQAIMYRNFHVSGEDFFALPQTRNEDLSNIKKFPGVKTVNLITAQFITGEGLHELKDLPIEKLDVRNLAINQSGFDAIGQMSNLKTLRIDYMPFITASKLASLSNAPRIELLGMAGTHLSKTCQSEIAKMPRLRRLILDRATGLNDTTLELLAHIPTLKRLSIEGIDSFSREGISKFRRERPDVLLGV